MSPRTNLNVRAPGSRARVQAVAQPVLVPRQVSEILDELLHVLPHFLAKR